MYDKEVLEEVENVMHKEDTEDEEMVKQVSRMVTIVILMCPLSSQVGRLTQKL